MPRERVEAVHPSPMLALVPATVEAGRVNPSRPTDSTVAFAVFFALGYMGSGLLMLSGWAGAVSVQTQEGLLVGGLLCLAMAGPAVLAYVFQTRTLRRALGSLAVLVAMTLAEEPVGRIAEEVYAGRMIPALQPLADDLARYDRVERLEISSRSGGLAPDPWVRLNRVQGRYAGLDLPFTTELMEEMRLVGITPAEVAALDGRMRQARVGLVEARDGHLVFRRMGVERWRLIFVRPGHLPPARATRSQGWTTEPLGGGWYLAR
jgi:hypothetical protein